MFLPRLAYANGRKGGETNCLRATSISQCCAALKRAFHINVNTKLPHTHAHTVSWSWLIYVSAWSSDTWQPTDHNCYQATRSQQAAGNCQLMQLLWQLKPTRSLPLTPVLTPILIHVLELDIGQVANTVECEGREREREKEDKGRRLSGCLQIKSKYAQSRRQDLNSLDK